MSDFDQLKTELIKDPPDFTKVRQLVSANIDLLNKPIDNFGRYVLHYACWKNAASSIVIEIINGNPSAVHQWSINGYYPLHFACQYNQSEAVIKLLLQEYPLAVQQKQKDEFYPLHIACQHNQSEAVIKLLLREYPLAIKQKGINGAYPLHSACQHNQSEVVIKLLLQEYPLAIQQKETDGYYPLHSACQNNQSESVIQLLLQEYPMAVQQKETHGHYPLHLACTGIASLEVIQLLAKHWPMALLEKTSDGKLPLDCYAKQPWHSNTPNKETMQWLENEFNFNNTLRKEVNTQTDVPDHNTVSMKNTTDSNTPTEVPDHDTVPEQIFQWIIQLIRKIQQARCMYLFVHVFIFVFLYSNTVLVYNHKLLQSNNMILAEFNKLNTCNCTAHNEQIVLNEGCARTDTIVGKGYFGTICPESHNKITIKTVDNDVLVQATNKEVARIKKILITEQQTESIQNRPTVDDVSKSLVLGIDKCMLQVALITTGSVITIVWVAATRLG